MLSSREIWQAAGITPPPEDGCTYPLMIADLRAVEAATRADERERCAQIADKPRHPLQHCCDNCSIYSEHAAIAAAIRAQTRGENDE